MTLNLNQPEKKISQLKAENIVDINSDKSNLTPEVLQFKLNQA